MNNDLLLVATILKTQGIKGELKLKLFTSFGKKRFKNGATVYLKKDGSEDFTLTALKYREANTFGFVTFEEAQTCTDAEKFVGYSIYKEKDSSLLKKDEYFYCDLEGLSVIDAQTLSNIGKVIEVVEFPAQITIKCVTNEGKEFFVPFIKAFICSVNLERKEIIINVIPGLI